MEDRNPTILEVKLKPKQRKWLSKALTNNKVGKKFQ